MKGCRYIIHIGKQIWYIIYMDNWITECLFEGEVWKRQKTLLCHIDPYYWVDLHISNSYITPVGKIRKIRTFISYPSTSIR